jgi:16S rRNA C1402 N4-methylase RsmH
MEYHNPVLLKESVDGFEYQTWWSVCRCDFGGGGHSREF